MRTLHNGRERLGFGISRSLRTPLCSASHICSFGDKPGLYGCLLSGVLLWLTRKLRCCTRGTLSGWRTSSRYLVAVESPAMTIKCLPRQQLDRPKIYPSQQRKCQRSFPHDVGKYDVDHLGENESNGNS